MAGRKRTSIRQAVLDFLETHRPSMVDRETLRRIRNHAAAATRRHKPPSPAYVLDILLDTEVPVDRAIGGIPTDLRGKLRTGNLAEAKRSLLAMAREYATAPDLQRASDVRRAVMRTKNHLRLALARGTVAEKREVKQEILKWLLVWLEHPGIFEPWLAVRESKAVQTEPSDAA